MELTGYIQFDPKDVTKKHQKQSTWKRTAMVRFPNCELDGLWRWYMKKRFGVIMQHPLRNAHVTFINDKYSNISKWNKVAQAYNGRAVKIEIPNDLRSNGEHWWLKIEKFPNMLTDIREELGLRAMPYFHPHFTIGLVNWKNLNHSTYIKNLMISGRV